jgi:hypothetical protein
MAKNKDQKPGTIKMLSIKKPPYFKRGTLVYADKGHTLTRDGHYYRCILNCRGKCAKHNKRIPTETLERAFARKIKILAINPDVAERILKKILRENLVDVLFGVDDSYSKQEERFELTLAVAKQDLQDSGKIKKEDVEEAIDSITKMHQAEYPTILLSFVLGTLRALANTEYEAETGRTFAFMSKKIVLSNDGKIDQIELELWAWYILNLIDRYIPGYLKHIKSKGVSIRNTSDEFLKLPVAQAALRFSMENTKEAMSVNMTLMYQLTKLMADGIKATVGNTDPKQAATASLLFLEEMKNNPALAIIMQMGNAINLKLE